MAINYTNLFEDIGEFLEVINNFRTLSITTLPAYEAEINVELTGNTMYELMGTVPSTFEGFQDTVVGWCTTLTGFITSRFTDFDTILTELPLGSSSSTYTTVLPEFYRQMVADVESVDGSAVTLGATSNDMVGDSDGVLISDKILDGYTAPGSGFAVCRDYAYDVANAKWPGGGATYAGTPTELAVVSETMTLTCTADSETDGATEGAESFSWIGGIAGSSAFDWESEGSGSGTSITVLNGAGLVSNGEFEDFTADAPDSWDIDNGSASTHINEETSVVKRGSAALNYLGDGAQATIQISQTLTGLTPLKRYCVACWVQGEAGIAAGALTIQMEGTGYTAGTDATYPERIYMNSAALAAQVAYGVEYFFFNTPSVIPNDFELVIKVTGTLTTAKNVYVDGLAFGPLNYHGGVGCVILAGADPFIRGDRFTFTVANDEAGTFQELFRRLYKHQLPSNLSGAETVADGLASD